MKRRPLLTLLVSMFLTTVSYGQLDSLHVSHNFNTIVDPNSPTDSLEVLEVFLWVNDTSDVGTVQISITDSIGIETFNFLSLDSTTFPSNYTPNSAGHYAFQFSKLPLLSTYKIDVTLTNSLGYFLSEQELAIPGN
jgi:hypothetical protein